MPPARLRARVETLEAAHADALAKLSELSGELETLEAEVRSRTAEFDEKRSALDEAIRRRDDVAETVRIEETRRDRTAEELHDLAGAPPPAAVDDDGTRSLGETAPPADPRGLVRVRSGGVTGTKLWAADRAASSFGEFQLADVAARIGESAKALRAWAKTREEEGKLKIIGKFKAAAVYEWIGVVEEDVDEGEADDDVAPEREDTPTDELAAPLVDEEAASLPMNVVLERLRTWARELARPFRLSEAGEYFEGLDAATVARMAQTLIATGDLAPVGVVGLELYEFVGVAPRRLSAVPGSGADAPTRGAPIAGTGKPKRISNADVRALVEACEAQGATWDFAGNQHIAVIHDGRRVLIANTPSSARSIVNDRARLRRELHLQLS